MSPHRRRRRPLRLFGALQSGMFYRENVVGGRAPSNDKKVPPERPRRGFSGLRAPSNDENFLRKVPPMTTVGRPPCVKWRPPMPPPRDVVNTLPAVALVVRPYNGATASRKKNKRVAVNKRNPMLPNVRVLDQPVTQGSSQDSRPQNRYWGRSLFPKGPCPKEERVICRCR